MDWRPNIYSMKSLLTTICLVVLSLVLQVSTCPRHLPDIPGVRCSCDKRFGHDYTGGWQIDCTKGDTEESAFFIDYAIGNYMKVQCDTVSPYQPRMFDNFSITEVQKFFFSYCEMPTIPFSEILAGMQVKGLQLQDCKTGEELTPDLFAGLDSLLRLDIINSKHLKRIPENFFENMTSLTSIYLNDNALSELPEKLFWPVTNVAYLQLAGNQMTKLFPNQFQGLTKLGSLFLYKNNLTGLPDEVFNDTISLKVLDLLSNKFTKLPTKSLALLSNLTNLRIANNPLQELQDMTFHNNKQLGELNLNGLNKLTSLPEKLLSGLNKLENISLSDCNLTNIPEKFFAFAANLKNIQMKNNRLKSLPPKLFLHNTKLNSLDMSYNDLTELPKNVFEKQFSLETLEFYKNNLVIVPKGVFDNLSRLKKLGLSSNMIEKIEDDAFQSLQVLETLNLNNNRITTLPSISPFGTNKLLTSVDLSYNNITELPSIEWSLYLSLKQINFDNNKIMRFSVPVMYCDVTVMSLRYNSIKTVLIDQIQLNAQIQDSDTTDNAGKSHSYYLEGNPFNCDCEFLDFAKYLKTDNDDAIAVFRDSYEYECQDPNQLKGKLVISVEYDSFQCEITENCPKECSCFYRKYDKTKHMICDNQNLTNLPMVFPNNTNVVSLKNNNITSLNGLDSPLWSNLTELNLDNNSINSLDDLFFPKHLQNLSLKNNQISTLPKDVRDFASKTYNFKIYLSGNPWKCDCSTLDFRTWILGHVRNVQDYSTMTCSSSFAFNDTAETYKMSDIQESTYCPPAVAGNQHKQLVIVSTLCAVLALLLVLVSVLYYKNRQTVIAYIYIHFHNIFVCIFDAEDLDEDKMFDAFVSYSSNDRDVAMGLLNNLENGEEKFKLCIHERDWLAGYNISWNIVNSVQNSRRTILVISKDFLESMWFQVEFHTAYYQMLEDRVDRLIVIVKGELPPKDSLDKELRFLLSTKTYLIWGERWFWEKLKYAMPHYNWEKVPPNKFPLRNRPNGHMIKTVEEQISNLTNNPKTSQKDVKNEDAPNRTQNNNATGEIKVEIIPDTKTVNGSVRAQRIAEQS